MIYISVSIYGTTDMVSKICELNEIDDPNAIAIGSENSIAIKIELMLYCPWRNTGMANDTNISREAKKKQLRRQVISSDELKKNKDYQRKRKQKQLHNWMLILGSIAIIAVVVLGVYIYGTMRTYKTFGVEWEQDLIGAVHHGLSAWKRAWCSWAEMGLPIIVMPVRRYGRCHMI